MPERESFFDRLKKHGPQEVVFDLARSAWNNLLWPAVNTVLIMVVGWTSYLFAVADQTGWVFKFPAILLSIGAALWTVNVARSAFGGRGVSRQQVAPQLQSHELRPYVEFWLPSNWQPGFRHKTLPSDQAVGDVLAEEVVLQVIAKRRMQNVRLQIRALHRQSNNALETLAHVGSDVFTGIVQKDQEQSFVIMQRAFWNTRAVYENPLEGGSGNTPVRVEKGVMFFPENPSAAFAGRLGNKYTFHVSILHDEGSENAYFSITLDPQQTFPQSRITSMDNIKPITRS